MVIELIKTERFKFINYCPVIINSEQTSCILVDPAWEQSKFMKLIKSYHLKVTAVLLTHHHLDHSHLASYFAKKYNCPVYMNRAEIDYYNFDCHGLKAIEPSQTTLTIEDFSTVIVHRTPGHTFGGVCYQLENALFTGDTLFNEGCGVCHTKGGDAGIMFHSLNYLQQVIAESVHIYPGHRFNSELGQQFRDVKKMNIYLNILTQEEFIKFRSHKGKSSLNFR